MSEWHGDVYDWLVVTLLLGLFVIVATSFFVL